ncbi:MAG: PAS domain S-box protein [Lachnospiraceae bacterium]|nr:PAS domain S-box protein [Lachnospiraceae bacterium]
MSYSKKKNDNPNNDYCCIYYKLLVENAIECVWVYDFTNKCFKYISPSILHLRGFTVEEAMRQKLEDSLTPASRLKSRESLRYSKFISGDRSYEVVNDISEFEQYCKDGSIKTMEISTRLAFNENTNAVEIFGASRDITHRKQYENELLKKLKSLTEKIVEPKQYRDETVSMLRVYFFDKFTVYGVNQTNPLKWRTRKTEELFAFLLHKENKKISKCEICDTLWPNTPPIKATTYFHTTLYNMKKDLNSAGIEIKINSINGYYFYELPTYYSDILEFKNILNNTFLPFDSVDYASAANYERLVSLYKGDYLNNNDYPWSFSESTLYRQQFEHASLALSHYYFLIFDYDSAKKILMRLIDIDNLNENFHELLLKIYLNEKDYSSFISHYSNIENLLLNELGTYPNSSIQNLYKIMLLQKHKHKP